MQQCFLILVFRDHHPACLRNTGLDAVSHITSDNLWLFYCVISSPFGQYTSIQLISINNLIILVGSFCIFYDGIHNTHTVYHWCPVKCIVFYKASLTAEAMT